MTLEDMTMEKLVMVAAFNSCIACNVHVRARALHNDSM